jgi:signal transduction histidine kinase/YHS domain-containing protein
MEANEQLVVDVALLRALQQRAAAMTRGDFSAQGQPLGGPAALEELRLAVDVLGAHTEQGLRTQHAYIAALSTAQEAERGRLARELHDEVVQQLIALGHGVERAQRLLAQNPQLADERLRAVRSAITQLVGELRVIIGDLRPPALQELGLLPALELLLGRSEASAPTVVLRVEGTERRLAPQGELALFRIVQEAWTNIKRHAAAYHAEVVLRFANDALVLTMRDDGRGFVVPNEETLPDGHWGLHGMRERAELMGGSLQISSAPGQGTLLVVQIPYPGEDGRDPVCGMRVGPADLGAEHAGKLYRFCSPACRDLFVAQPTQYIART